MLGKQHEGHGGEDFKDGDVLAAIGGRDALKNDYLSRATGAQMGLFAFGGSSAPPAPARKK